MSSVNVSRPNCDIVNVSVEQTGKATVDVYFKKPFLAEGEKYVCAVSGLTVPMMSTRLLPNNAHVTLFSVYRRNAGQDITSIEHVKLDGTGVQNGAQLVGTISQEKVGNFNVANIPLHNINDVLVLLNAWSSYFESSVAEVGINPIFYGATNIAEDGTITPPQAIGIVAGSPKQALLRFGISPSGVLIITPQPMWSNHFYMALSEMGRELFGLPAGILTIAVTQNQATGHIERFGVGLQTGDTIQPANVSIPTPIFCSRSLLETLESRLSVHLESALPYHKTIVSENQIEKSSYDLCSFVLNNDSTSTIYMKGTKVENHHTFTTSTHTGQKVLQSRVDAPTQWTQLLDTRDLRILRLRLYIKIRTYNTTTKTWSVEKVVFPISEFDRWTCDLRFISTE